MKALLRALIGQGIEALRANGTLPADTLPPDFVVERPKTREHGDFATNAAMLLAKAARSNPRAVAQALVAALPASDDVASIEIAGPGFINFKLAPVAYQREVAGVLKQGADYGRNLSGNGRSVGVEYVSANPTGPLHVGHGRAGAIGDCIARVLEANGWNAKREFYYNDAGVQIENLARSVQARARGFKPGDAQWPADAYNGEYIDDVAKAYLLGQSVELEGSTVTGSGNAEDIDSIRRFAVAWLRNEQNLDLAAFGVDFDIYFLESSLYKDGKVADDIGTPDIILLLSEEMAVVDNVTGKLTLVVYAEPGVPGAYQKAQARLKELLAKLREPVAIPTETPSIAAPAVSMFGESHFKQAVLKAKHYITEGEIMQVVLSQRMSKPFSASPMALYRSLRSLNPSPYMFYFDFEDFHVVGASPEILVRLEGDTVTVRPIAGTRKRGATFEEDQALAAELLADEKECAEHLQLLDLGRNDTGRVAQVGTVKLTEKMTIERYSHVMHIVSNVEGKLQPGLAALDVLRATFPAGTVSGAPKVRAMEIIDELEPSGRGIYAGAVGYLGFHGDMDLAIAIRTALVKDGQLYVQAGGGIVADSVPESEWQETQNKARAVLRAAELAENGLDTRFD